MWTACLTGSVCRGRGSVGSEPCRFPRRNQTAMEQGRCVLGGVAAPCNTGGALRSTRLGVSLRLRSLSIGGGSANGLRLDWTGRRVYCNPPYGPAITAWLSKHAEAALAVYLLPSRTDTRWWHEYTPKAREVRFVKGRLHFNDAKEAAPFPSVILIFGDAA